jgi:hypothetical protein
MNRNPDGSMLTTDDLLAICDRAGIKVKLGDTHGDNAVRSFLLDATTKVRFNDTSLKLNTRNTWVPKPADTIDRDVFDFLCPNLVKE